MPTARADDPAPPAPPTDGPPVAVTPVTDPAPDPAPPGLPSPPPPPSDPTPPSDSQPGAQETPSPPSNSGGDQWTTSPDRSSDSSSPQSAGSTSGTGADSTSGAVLASPDTRSSSGKGKNSLAIAPGVDDFDSFSGVDSGGTSLLPDGAKGCATAACTSAPRGFAVSVAVSVQRLRETAARERDASRVEGLARAMPPSPPGGLPGRAYSMPGSAGGGGGGAPLLISVMAVLATALAIDWAKSFRLPTATWRLSAYVPPIEHPG